jgi:hypothetical protein
MFKLNEISKYYSDVKQIGQKLAEEQQGSF